MDARSTSKKRKLIPTSKPKEGVGMLKYLVRASGETHEAAPVLSDSDDDQSQNEKGSSDVATRDDNNKK